MSLLLGVQVKEAELMTASSPLGRANQVNGSTSICSGVWVTETIDTAGDVGGQPSLALEPTFPHSPHISYYSYSYANGDFSGDLKYAQLSGSTWISETVDSEGEVGEQSSLALATAFPYTVAISYYDHDPGWGLNYACKDDMSWTIMELDSGRSGQFGTSLALEPTYPYMPRISYQKPFGLYDLRYTYISGTSWCTGTWGWIPWIRRGM